MNKRYILPALIFIIILALAMIGYTSQSTQKAAVMPPLRVVPTISVNQLSRPVNTGAISYSVNVTNESFPARLPYYAINQANTTQSVFNRFSFVLGVSGQNETIHGSRGAYLSTTDGPKSLIVSDNPLYFSYEEATLSGARISQNTIYYQQATLAKLQTLDVLPKPLVLSSPTYQFMNPQGTDPNATSNANGATVAQIDYGVSLDGYRVYVGDADSPAYSARFDGANRLVELGGYVFPTIRKSNEDIAVISYDEAVGRLQNNEGVLSSATPTEYSVAYLNPAILQSVQVRSAALGFFYSPALPSLVPVYVFRGTSSVQEIPGPIDTTTIVSAIP